MKYLKALKQNYDLIKQNLEYANAQSGTLYSHRIAYIPVNGVRLMTIPATGESTGFHVAGFLTMDNNEIPLCFEIKPTGKGIVDGFWVSYTQGRISMSEDDGSIFNACLMEMFPGEQLQNVFGYAIMTYAQKMKQGNA